MARVSDLVDVEKKGGHSRHGVPYESFMASLWLAAEAIQWLSQSCESRAVAFLKGGVLEADVAMRYPPDTL
jgi:hypothetical protein